MAKINNQTAFLIATRVSTKAFEHLLVPAQETFNTMLLAAYYEAVQGCGFTREIARAIYKAHGAQKNGYYHIAGQATLQWDVKGKDTKVQHNVMVYAADDDKATVPEHVLSIVNITAPKRIDLLNKQSKYISDLQDKATAMRKDIVAQIDGRTTKVVLDSWPELRVFVEEVFPQTNVAPNPVPFQMLLNKHLKALPAPQAAPAMVK